MFTFIVMGIGQALIVTLGNYFALGVDVRNPAYSVWFAVLIAITFMIMVYVLVALFGNVGKGIAIIILVLSISGGGGNYPIQVSGKFFQMINPFLPFTHAVNLLRNQQEAFTGQMLGLQFGLWWGFQSSLVLAAQFFIHIWNTDRKICGFSAKEPFIPLKTKAENVSSVFGFYLYFQGNPNKEVLGALAFDFWQC